MPAHMYRTHETADERGRDISYLFPENASLMLEYNGVVNYRQGFKPA